MIKTIAIIGFLSVAIPLNAYAEDSGRIDHLEKEVQELKLRISKLESLLSKPNAVQQAVTSSEGYKSIANWRRLTTDMGYSDVRKLLGEPTRVDGGQLAHWHYPNGGQVFFTFGKVERWQEP